MKSKKIIQLLGLVLLISLITLAIPTPSESIETTNSDSPLMVRSPVIGSYTPPPPGEVMDIAVAGDVMYVAAEDGGLRVLDISDPTNPTEIGSYNESTDDTIQSLAIAGDVLYVQNGTHLMSFNISDPTNPTRKDLRNPVGNDIFDMKISGDVMYLAKGGYGFDSWDISNPDVLSLLDPEGSWVVALEVSGDIAVAVEYYQITIFDVSDPTAISEITNIPVSTTVLGGCVALHGNIAYVGFKDIAKRLLAIDLSDPTQPVVLFNDTSINAYDIAIAGDLLYVAGSGSGIKCFPLKIRF